MRSVTRVYILNEQGEKFFGEGPYRLLRLVEEEGSLLQAAKKMEMAYSKAVRILKNAEASLGFPLLHRMTGGKSGGGSTLTEEGRSWADRYEAFRDACTKANEAFFSQYFGFRCGCVIMASGLGKRFGGNKLMAEFQNQPLIGRILDATDGLFSSRVAVTRNEETAAYLKSRQLDTILHTLPGRNDTVRLGLEKVMETDVSGCMFCQADQPLLRKESIKKILACAEKEPEFIWRPEACGEPGSPVWFPKAFFPELLALPEGKGGGALIRKYPDKVRTVSVEDPEELRDVDTKEDLERMEKVCGSESV